MDRVYYEGWVKEMIKEASRYDIDSLDIKEKDIKIYAKKYDLNVKYLMTSWNQIKYRMSNK